MPGIDLRVESLGFPVNPSVREWPLTTPRTPAWGIAMTEHTPTQEPVAGIQHEGESTTKSAWPIRVGGRYLSNFHSDETYFRVTAINGETVHFVHSHADGREFYPMDFSVRLFCKSAHPEDQSPIPELLAALKAAYRWMSKIDASYQTQGIPMGLEEQIVAAIDKAEGRHV